MVYEMPRPRPGSRLALSENDGAKTTDEEGKWIFLLFLAPGRWDWILTGLDFVHRRVGGDTLW